MASSRRSASSSPVDDRARRLRATVAGCLASSLGTGDTGCPPARIAVAFSGGLDSTVLLDLVAAVWPRDRLVALHVHHHLQPAADDWPAFCRRVAAAYDIASDTLHADGAPARGDSLESWARTARYRLLADAARSRGAAVVLTAHHRDDQLETLLMRVQRGTGPRGLAGVLDERHVHGVRFVRPLLRTDRAQLRAHAVERGLCWCEDPSNTDLQRTRNRVRLQLAPALDRTAPRWRPTLLQAREQAREVSRRLDAQAAADLALACLAPQAGLPPMLDRARLRGLPGSRRTEALRHWLHGHRLAPPSRAQTAELVRQMLDGASASAWVVCDGWNVLRYRDRVLLLPAGEQLQSRLAQARVLAPTRLDTGPDGRLTLPAGLGTLWLDAWPAHREAVAGGPVVEVLSGQVGALRFAARPGQGRRTLKNLYQEAGIPDWLRPLFPVLRVGGDLAWSAAFGPAEGLRQQAVAGGETRRPEGPVTVAIRWDPAGDGPLAALLRWHARQAGGPPDQAEV